MRELVTNVPPERDAAAEKEAMDRRIAELLCAVVKAGSGRTITPEQLLANARGVSQTNTQENSMQFITNAADTDTDEGALLRLASEFQTLVRGASPSAIVKLGEKQLTAFKKAIETAQADLMAKATKVKTAINSSLSVADLMGLGEVELNALAAKAGVTVSGRASDEYEGYSINAIVEEVLAEKR